MKHIECIMPSATTVYVERPDMKRLAVDVFTPIAVPDTDEEQAALGPRFVPLRVAQRLVEHGMGSWRWCGLATGSEPEETPAPILSGSLPDDFPHAKTLRSAGFSTLDQVPKSISDIAKIPGLGVTEPGERATKQAKNAAARQILDALDAIIRKEE